MSAASPPGRAWVGTSGFAYPDWAPRFYPPGLAASRLLPAYAERLSAVELNNTFYQQPSPERIAAWLAAAGPAFRFSVKAQRGGSYQVLRGDAVASVAWMTAPYRHFGARLGSVLFRVAKETKRDDDALSRLLDAWPVDLPLTLELQHESWLDDEVHARIRDHGAVLCATDLDDLATPPDLRRTGAFLYLRLRRTSYTDTDLADWAARLTPFLGDGMDVHVFFRHDADGTSAVRAQSLAALLGAISSPAAGSR